MNERVLSEKVAEIEYDTGQKFLIGFESGEGISEKQYKKGNYPRIRLYVWSEYNGEKCWNGWLSGDKELHNLESEGKTSLDVDWLIEKVDSRLKSGYEPNVVSENAEVIREKKY